MDAAASLAAWIAALMRPRDREPLVAAVADDVRIERHGPIAHGAEPAAPPAEIFDGVEAAAWWLHRLPRAVTFTIVGAPLADGEAWRVEYALEVAGFVGGGIWVARFADDGRLAHLSHRPFPLPGQDLAATDAPPSAHHDHAHADHAHDHDDR